MPETIGGYELFQLPCSKESVEAVAFAEYRSDLGNDGHVAQVAYGSDTGFRKFTLPYDPLPGGAHETSITIDSVPMTKATYIRDVFKRNKLTGVPIVIQSGESGQYYLVDFDESEQTLDKKLGSLYSTTVNFVRYRDEDGSNVFDMTKLNGVWGWWKADAGWNAGTGAWTDQIGGRILERTGTHVTQVTGVQNDLPVIRFNSGTADSFLSADEAVTVYDLLMILKIRENTFSSNAGIFTSMADSVRLLTGDSGESFFADQGFSRHEYRKNGIDYADNDQQAPMNRFGFIHCRSRDGVSFEQIQFGRNETDVGTYTLMDIGEILVMQSRQPLSDLREAGECMQDRWMI